MRRKRELETVTMQDWWPVILVLSVLIITALIAMANLDNRNVLVTLYLGLAAFGAFLQIVAHVRRARPWMTYYDLVGKLLTFTGAIAAVTQQVIQPLF